MVKKDLVMSYKYNLHKQAVQEADNDSRLWKNQSLLKQVIDFGSCRGSEKVKSVISNSGVAKLQSFPNLAFLSCGDHGVAFSVGNNQVLKLTTDEQEIEDDLEIHKNSKT